MALLKYSLTNLTEYQIIADLIKNLSEKTTSWDYIIKLLIDEGRRTHQRKRDKLLRVDESVGTVATSSKAFVHSTNDFKSLFAARTKKCYSCGNLCHIARNSSSQGRRQPSYYPYNAHGPHLFRGRKTITACAVNEKGGKQSSWFYDRLSSEVSMTVDSGWKNRT